LYTELNEMLELVAPLLPTTVDMDRLIKYTLLYYRARAQLRCE
jgi:hypothetical protein